MNLIQSVVIFKNEVQEVVRQFGADFDAFEHMRRLVENKHPDSLLFTRMDGSPFTYKYFMKILNAITDALNIRRGHFGGHSGRIYLATLLALQGAEDSEIQERGRWLSLAFKMYVRSLSKRQYLEQSKITFFRLSDLNFVLEGFPNSPEFRK